MLKSRLSWRRRALRLLWSRSRMRLCHSSSPVEKENLARFTTCAEQVSSTCRQTSFANQLL